MPNGDELNDQMEFEHNLKEMPPDDRLFFIAKQTYALTNGLSKVDKKVDALDVKFDSFNGTGISKKTSATTGGITAAILVGIVEGLKTLFGRS